MPRPIISPRRGEPWFTQGGYPTIRLSEYIEASSDVLTDVQGGVVNDIDIADQLSEIEFFEHWRG